MANQIDFERRVELIVDRRIFNHEAIDGLRNMLRINDMIDSRVRSQVPAALNNELAKVLPLFIENHSFIQNVLANHLPKVEQRIEETTRATIARLVREDQYRTVNAAFLDDLESKYRDDIKRLRRNVHLLTAGWIATSLVGMSLLVLISQPSSSN